MEEHAYVPKFGNRVSTRNVLSTIYFENARKGSKGGNLINAGGTQQNPNAYPWGVASEPEIPKPKREQHTSNKAGSHHDLSDFPVCNDSIGRNLSGDGTNVVEEQQAYVPKFGNWEGNGNIAYTEYFDNAQKGRNDGKLTNHSKPKKNTNSFPEGVSMPPTSLRNEDREDGDCHGRSSSMANNNKVGWKPDRDGDVSIQQHRELMDSNDHRTTNRVNGGSKHNIKRSPLHQNSPVKSAGKSGISPSTWGRKGSSEGHGFAPSPTTQGRSKPRPADKGNQTVDKGSAVPRFGDWDVSDPSSADGFTDVFDNVRKEKKVGSSKVPIIKTDPVFDDSRRQERSKYDSSGCVCFGWRSK